MSVSGKFCARPVNPFGRGRPWLRWTRALCKFNWGKGGSGGVPRLCCSAQPATLRAREIGYGARVSRRLSLWGLEEKIGLVESQRDTERASARRVFALERVVSCSRSDQTRKPENCPARGRIAHGVIRDYRRRRPLQRI